MLLLRSSRLAVLARSRPAAFSSKANRQSVISAVASPSRKAEECAKDERISSSGVESGTTWNTDEGGGG